MESIAKKAKDASRRCKILNADDRNKAVDSLVNQLQLEKSVILIENQRDLERANNLNQALLSRLDISKKYDSMVQGIKDVRDLEDPVGKIFLHRKLDHDLTLYRTSSPLGVILVIFEARPEVIANISALAIKSGNAVILKGGNESQLSLAAMTTTIRTALKQTKIPLDAVQLVSDRDEVAGLLREDKYIDLVIPRGSKNLVQYVKENTRIPVLGHADGLCSIYIHEDADVSMASKVVIDAKTDYPAACNAVETLIIHRSFLPNFGTVAKALDDLSVSLRCDAASLEATTGCKDIIVASLEDYETEFLNLTLAVKTVDSLAEAIDHINCYGSGHTDCILTQSAPAAEIFMNGVDSAGTYWNCSTRFADGFRYGFGAEVGISTNKIHARGPVGLEGLLTYQYRLLGNGNVAHDYTAGTRQYLHQDCHPKNKCN